MSMRKVLPLALLLVAGAATAAETPKLGKPISEADIKAWDITILPDGTNLPPGQGTAAEGAKLFVENLGRTLADVGAHPRHFAWREGRPDGTALIGVLGPVHRDEVGHRFFIRAAIDDADPATIGPGRGIDVG